MSNDALNAVNPDNAKAPELPLEGQPTKPPKAARKPKAEKPKKTKELRKPVKPAENKQPRAKVKKEIKPEKQERQCVTAMGMPAAMEARLVKQGVDLKALKSGCKVKLRTPRSRRCDACNTVSRKAQQKYNLVQYEKRAKKGEVAHHLTYRGKPSTTALKLKALGLDATKYMKGESTRLELPASVLEKLSTVEMVDGKPVKPAPASKPAKKVAKKKAAA